MSALQLLGYRSFKSELSVRTLVLNEIINNWDKNEFAKNAAQAIDPILFDPLRTSSLIDNIDLNYVTALNIFQTSKQRTWLLVVLNDLYCVLDDIGIDIEAEKELIKWKVPISQVKPTAGNSDKSTKYGLMDFNSNRRRWYYSKELLGEPENAEYSVANLMWSTGFNAQNIYMTFKNRNITIVFKEGSDSQAKYGKYISGVLWFPSLDKQSNFYSDIKVGRNQTNTHQLIKLGFALTEAAKALYRISDLTAKQLKEEEGFFCWDIENIIYVKE